MTATLATPPLRDDELLPAAAIASALVDACASAVRAPRQSLEACVIALLSGGHVMIEDVPGVGKTVLAKSLARAAGCDFSRLQCTADLLPSDVTGITVWDQNAARFVFRPGPVFANLVLVDEINRASPKTQSALLECMEEGQVTVDGETRLLPAPFMIIATQNPVEYEGTFPLPEAQLDRFLMKTAIGYPDAEATIGVLSGLAVRDRAAGVTPVIDGAQVLRMRQVARSVHVSRPLLEFVQALAERSRDHRHLRLGLSVRGMLGYVHAAKAWAAGQGRNYVVPDDLKELAVPVMQHRMLLDPDAQFEGVTVPDVVDELFDIVPLPPVAGR